MDTPWFDSKNWSTKKMLIEIRIYDKGKYKVIWTKDGYIKH